jgi:hypothetical protein
MSTGSTPNHRTPEGGTEPETVGTGGTRRRRTRVAPGTEATSVSETAVETSALAENLSGGQTAGSTGSAPPTTPLADAEEIISLTAWRPGFGIRAAMRHDLATVNVPVVGPVTLPGFAHLAWYAGVAALTVLEIVEPPVAALMVVAKALSDSRHHEMLRSFGEGVESGV